jgi:putative hydrolase of the HAD superfamily
MNSNYIKAVIFDIGRVLVEVNLTQGVFRFLDLQDDTTDLKILNELLDDQVFVEFSKGRITPEEFYSDFKAKTKIDLSYSDFVFHWQNIFKPIKGMDSLCRQLSENYEIGILSDIDTLHWQYLKDELEIFSYVKRPTLSYQVGYMKPQREIYKIAVENVGYPAENCLFIDDREINVKGAIDYGMEAIHFVGIRRLRDELSKIGLI